MQIFKVVFIFSIASISSSVWADGAPSPCEIQGKSTHMITFSQGINSNQGMQYIIDKYGCIVKNRYSDVYQGVSVKVSDPQTLERLKKDPRIQAVVDD